MGLCNYAFFFCLLMRCFAIGVGVLLAISSRAEVMGAASMVRLCGGLHP